MLIYRLSCQKLLLLFLWMVLELDWSDDKTKECEEEGFSYIKTLRRCVDNKYGYG